MTARLLLSLVLSLPLCALADAAPAPFQRAAEPDRPEVALSGWLHDARLAAGAPSVITRQSDYEPVARAFGIANPPRVDFRTHFLFVHVSSGYGEIRCQIGTDGDLRAVESPVLHRGCKDGRCGLDVAGNRYLITSFRRSAVKSVNGVALPRK
jgi:hypothetical protein